MLEYPKAHIPKQNDEKCINVMVVKTEKSYEMMYGQILNIIAMGNQQGSSKQENPQRLFPLREVERKRLAFEVVRPTYVGEDIVCTLSKGKGLYRISQIGVAAYFNIMVFSIVIPGDQE